MNELRSEIYHQQNAKSHRDLPPTSQGIESHIRRSFFNTHCILNSIKITEEPCLLLNSLDWGFALDGDYILPNFNLRCLEDELTVIVDVKNVQADQLVHVVLPLYHVLLFVNTKAMNVKIPLKHFVEPLPPETSTHT